MTHFNKTIFTLELIKRTNLGWVQMILVLEPSPRSMASSRTNWGTFGTNKSIRRELHSTEVAFALLIQRSQDQFLHSEKNYLDLAEIFQQHWLGESGQRLGYVDCTHQVLAIYN